MPIREHTSDPWPTGTPERTGKSKLELELGWSRLEDFLAWGWRLAKDACCPGAAAGKDRGAGVSGEIQEGPGRNFPEIWTRFSLA